MKVIKLGGSLMSDPGSLKQCLTTIEKKIKHNIVIVPGGGQFADLIRSTQQQWGFGDATAHHMAILAMKQMALLFKSIKPDFALAETAAGIQNTALNHSIVIWSPNEKELDADLIGANWDFTSDSIAAWLAEKIAATDLVLVKSVNISNNATIQNMQKQGIIDQAFNKISNNANYKIMVTSKQKFNEHIFS